jgi:hypothetical protein
MKVGVIIPDRGDRPEFLKNCLRMIEAQTIKPEIKIINHSPMNNDCDITQRYRIGYDSLRNLGIDIIALIENDDWYSKNYLEIMINEWLKHGKPDIFGLNHTIYYHIRLKKHFTMHHNTRSSAMNTLIKPDLNFKWCRDIEAFTDIHLWNVLKGTIINPPKTICMGIKHGIGKCGGRSHVDKLHRFTFDDQDFSFLKNNLDKEAFDFYSNYFHNGK